MIIPAHSLNHIDALRVNEKLSILRFVEQQRRFLSRGRVLDFGAGLQPYKKLVGGLYIPYTIDHPSTPSGSKIDLSWEPFKEGFDSILCTQVVQYVKSIKDLWCRFHEMLYSSAGYVVMTYPTTWPEVEAWDMCRFTGTGMEVFAREAGFDIISNDVRLAIDMGNYTLPVGYGMVVRVR